MTEAVLDAGPLIHLAELDALDVLGDLVLYVAEMVWQEAITHRPQLQESKDINLKRLSASAPSAELQTLARALTLDRGEVEALCLMEKYPNALFLTDDAAARLAAEQRGYQVHGTIGLLIRSVRQGQRTPHEIVNLLRTIPEHSTLFIRPDLLSAIVARLEREWPRRG